MSARKHIAPRGPAQKGRCGHAYCHVRGVTPWRARKRWLLFGVRCYCWWHVFFDWPRPERVLADMRRRLGRWIAGPA